MAGQDATDTQRRRDLEAMLDAITDYKVIKLGPDGNIATWNRGGELLTGYTAAEVIGQHVSIFYTEEDKRSGLAERELQTARDVGRFEFEGWRVRKDGEHFWASVILTPIVDGDGTLGGYVKVTRDLTERREQELRLERQREEIMELSTPVIQVWDGVLALPIIGTLDSVRAARLTEGLLERIGDSEAQIVILDISGVPTIDTQVAQHLLKTVQAATLMGAASILSGVRPETAQAMVHLGIDIGQMKSRNTLRDALQLALQMIRERASARAAAMPLGAE
jgi:PAS domain S-box-containing protein